jgi:AcrR family transcriptional regulator
MDVREALVEAALKTFAAVGMRGATTRRIAHEAHVNEVTLFRHFKTKEDLLQAAIESFAHKGLAHPLPANPIDPRVELLAWSLAHHRELHRHRAFIRKAMSEFEEHPAQCTLGMCTAIRLAAELTAYFGRLKHRGLARGAWDEPTASNTLLGALFGDAIGRDTMPERYPYSIDEAVARYVDLLLLAIGTTEPGRSKTRATKPPVRTSSRAKTRMTARVTAQPKPQPKRRPARGPTT